MQEKNIKTQRKNLYELQGQNTVMSRFQSDSG